MTEYIDFTAENGDSETDQKIPAIGVDTVTICRAADKGLYTKYFAGGSTDPVKKPRATFNDFFVEPVNSIHDLARVLTDLRPDYRACVVRGSLINPQDDRHIRRSHRKNPSLEERPHRWFMIDIDRGDFVIDPRDPEAAVRHIQQQAPILRDVTVFWHCSASWGLKPSPEKPGLKLHLWFWATDFLNCDAIKTFVSSLPIQADLSIYTPSQPHYTADPYYEATTGSHDPTEGVERSGIIYGALDEIYIGDGNALNELMYWSDRIRDIEDGDPRHPIINNAAYFLGMWIGAGYLDYDTVLSELVAACADCEAFSSGRIASAEDEIKRALADGMEKPRVMEQWKALFIRNQEGVPRNLLSNFIVLMRHHPDMRGRLAYDERSQKSIVMSPLPWDRKGAVYPRDIENIDVIDAVNWVSTLPSGAIPTNGRAEVNAAMEKAAHDTKIDEVRHWIHTLPPWDGKPRLSELFIRACGAVDDEYHRAVARTFLISMIARGLRPGCKADTMPILCGKQGTYKSTMLSILGSGPGEQYFSADIGDIRDGFSYLPTVKGKWLIEIEELAQFGGRHVEAIKSFVTKAVHVAREPYQPRSTTYKVGYVLVGTTNKTAFLTDTTGNRRFHVIEVTRKIDIAWVRDNRAQLFAEAKRAYDQKEQWYLTPELEAISAEVQERYTTTDGWIPTIRDYVDSPPTSVGPIDFDGDVPLRRDSVTVSEILTQALDIPKGRIDTKYSMRAGECLTAMGWTKKRIRVGGKRERVYVRPTD